jgi:hypothetical protein
LNPLFLSTREPPLNWIVPHILEAQKAAPVGATVAAHLEQALTGTMRERALRGAELAELARALIGASERPKGGDVP